MMDKIMIGKVLSIERENMYRKNDNSISYRYKPESMKVGEETVCL